MKPVCQGTQKRDIEAGESYQNQRPSSSQLYPSRVWYFGFTFNFSIVPMFFKKKKKLWPQSWHMDVPGPEIKPVPLQRAKLLQLILNPLHHSSNSICPYILLI